MQNKIKWIGPLALVLILLLFLAVPEVQAQCPMCRMSAESNLKAGGSAGKGLNAGILMMFFMPYVMVAFIGYLWWRHRKKQADSTEEVFFRKPDGPAQIDPSQLS